MAIDTYANLQTSIANWLHRTDLTALIPDFITLAEKRMNGEIYSRFMQTTATLTCAPGSTLAARYVTLPSDLIDMKRLTVLTEPAVVLEYKSPDQLVEDNAYQLSAGIPQNFTIVGNMVEMSPPPDSAYSLELIYMQRVPSLSNVNTTNWVLTESPNIYLFGALSASVGYTQDESHLPLWESKFKDAVKDINNVDWYTGTTMRVKVR